MDMFPVLAPDRAAAPRTVAQLTFAELLVIWALRRYTGCHLSRVARAAVVAPEFARVLGLARLEVALAALARVADSLASSARLPQALAVLEDDRINATEEALLATLAALQRGAAAQAAALSEWSLLPAGRAAFLAAAETLAQALREAGHVIPYTSPPRRALRQGDRRDALLLPTGSCAAERQPAGSGAVHTVH